MHKIKKEDLKIVQKAFGLSDDEKNVVKARLRVTFLGNLLWISSDIWNYLKRSFKKVYNRLF